MEEEYLTLDKDYLKAFNAGYTLSQETSLNAETLDKLNPEQLAKLNINKSRLETIKQGMKQHAKDKKLGFSKGKSNKIEVQSKDKVPSKDKDFSGAFDKMKREQEKNEQNRNKGQGKGYNR